MTPTKGGSCAKEHLIIFDKKYDITPASRDIRLQLVPCLV